MKKIKFFQTWNKEAKALEWSLTRLQMAVMTGFSMLFITFYHIKHEASTESILLALVLLVASFTPKALKDLIEKRF